MLVALVETLMKHNLPHPPITLLFTVREESGLHGARELDPKDLNGAVMCFNVDGRLASELIVGAVGQENWEVAITGKASHAGVAPEKGILAWLKPRLRAGSARSSNPMAMAQATSASSAAVMGRRRAMRQMSSPTTPG
jgi:tripeptide aminopeptidase